MCWAAQSEPRVEVVFLPPMVSLGLCVCACTPGAAWGHRRGPGEPWKEGWRERGMEGEEVSGSLPGKGAGLGWWPNRKVERRVRWSDGVEGG